jgi:hypothetical protein
VNQKILISQRGWLRPLCILTAVMVMAFVSYKAWHGETIWQPNYLIEVSPDGQRIAIIKWAEEGKWRLFVRSLKDDEIFEVTPPDEKKIWSSVAFSATEDALYFTTWALKPGQDKTQLTPESYDYGLWRMNLKKELREKPSEKVLDGVALSSMLPMKDGSIAFLGYAGYLQASDPVFRLLTGRQGWSKNRWMLLDREKRISLISEKEFTFFYGANLIRDEWIVMVQRKYPRDDEEKFIFDVMPLNDKANTENIKDVLKINLNVKNSSGPHFLCNWSGQYCANSTILFEEPQRSNLDIFLEGKHCSVTGFPARIERSTMPAQGGSVFILAREKPNRYSQFHLIKVVVDMATCSSHLSDISLP